MPAKTFMIESVTDFEASSENRGEFVLSETRKTASSLPLLSVEDEDEAGVLNRQPYYTTHYSR